MNIIWKTATLTVILFIALINNNILAKEIDENTFTNLFVDIRGRELTLDTSKQQAFILIIDPFCSQCVKQIISELKYEKDSVEIFFLVYVFDLEDKYSQRSKIDFLHDNYEASAKVFFFDETTDVNRLFNTQALNTPELFLYINGKLNHLSYKAIFPNAKFDYKFIRKYFKK